VDSDLALDSDQPFSAADRTLRLKDSLDVVGTQPVFRSSGQLECIVSQGGPEVRVASIMHNLMSERTYVLALVRR